MQNLTTFWKEFADVRKREKDSSSEEVTLNREFELDGQVIRIALDNDLQQEMLSMLRHELISFLRQRLDAPELSLDFRVAPMEVKRMPYTAQEKFNYMAEKNPTLKELQDALGLDTDF